MDSKTTREFSMSEADFSKVSTLAYKYTGIVLGDHKKDMVYGRLARRLRQLGLNDVGSYCRLIENPDHEEVSQFINAITTNLTSFFREKHHFDFLRDTYCKELMSQPGSSRRVRAWSAACSTGEEPYSMAMTLREKLVDASWDCKILATDLDSKVLEHGRNGVYESDRIEGLEPSVKNKWFVKDAMQAGSVKVNAEIQKMVRFKRLNLLEPWPMKGPFDFIFCRNVFIYFDQPTQQKILKGFANMLLPGGYLFIGHSENLHESSALFEPCGKTVFRRK